MQTLPNSRTNDCSPLPSVSAVLWEFPVAAPVVGDGDPNDFSMHFAREYQDNAEKQFLLDKNTILTGQLCIKTLELDIAHNNIQELRACIQSLEDKNSLLTSELKQFRDKEEAQARLSQEIWTPVERKIQAPSSTSAWNPSPEFLDNPAVRTGTSPPITLSQVLRGLGYQCSGTDLRKLAAMVHEAFQLKHGHPPRPMIYYDDEGQAERLSCFTEDDRGFLEEVLTSSALLKARHRHFPVS